MPDTGTGHSRVPATPRQGFSNSGESFFRTFTPALALEREREYRDRLLEKRPRAQIEKTTQLAADTKGR